MKNPRNCRSAAIALALMGLVCGCSHNGNDTSTVKSQPALISIQDNPNIPPQARAALLHNLQSPTVTYHPSSTKH